MSDAVVVLTTLARDADAGPLATALVELHLAACVNILSGVRSVYRWEGAVSSDDEQLLVIKTTRARVDALREELLRRHPYEVPEFVVLPVAAMSASYGAWLLNAVAPPQEEDSEAGGRQK